MQPSIQIIGGELHLLGNALLPLHLVVLLAMVGTATVFDVRERRIPNWLVATGMLIGLLFHTFVLQGAGTAFALSGLAVGIVTLFPLYALGLMGAGDAKLMGMIGSFLGMAGVFGAIVASMAAGGVLALCMASCKRMLPQLLANVHLMLLHRDMRKMGEAAGTMAAMPSVGKMPYAVAILAGTLIQLFVLRY